MGVFGYRDGRYCAENVPVRRIADTCGTPFYCYSRTGIESAFDTYVTAFNGQDVLICYALKANSNQAVIRLLAARGAGADVVSEGELRRALAAGIPADRIVFSGVAKTISEIEFALASDIKQFNVESEPELQQIGTAATRLGKRARVAFRINPDIDAGTHEKISTRKSENKFGVPWQSAGQVYADAVKLPGIEVVGLDIHIGSQILSLEPYKQAFVRIARLVEQLRRDGHRISTIDLGGGLGINYEPGTPAAPTPKQYAALVAETLGHLDCGLIIEPGRSLVASSGTLVGSVIYVKNGPSRRFSSSMLP